MSSMACIRVSGTQGKAGRSQVHLLLWQGGRKKQESQPAERDSVSLLVGSEKAEYRVREELAYL